MKCENTKKNNDRCNCTYSGCPRHGICCECIAYHNRMGEFPACMFSNEAEKTWDRSFAMLKKDREN